MHKQLANHPDLKVSLGHAPDLTFFQRLLARPTLWLAFLHAGSLRRNKTLGQSNRIAFCFGRNTKTILS
jgi:hypothetical protein